MAAAASRVRVAAAKHAAHAAAQFAAPVAGSERASGQYLHNIEAAGNVGGGSGGDRQGGVSEPRASGAPPIDFGLAFALAPVGLIVSRQRIMVDCNEAACEIFGFSRELMIGQSFQLIYPSMDEYLRQGERMLPALGTRGRWSDQRVMRRASGESFWCRVSGRALDRSDPHASGIWCFEDLGTRQPVKAELTSREREVALLAAQGLTNKEIATRLFVTVRTAEYHIHHALAKLKLASRQQLRVALADLSAPQPARP